MCPTWLDPRRPTKTENTSREDNEPMFKSRSRFLSLAAFGGLAVMTLAPAPSVYAAGTGFDWKWTPAQIEKAGDQAMKTADKKYDAIAAMPDAKRTFANTVRAMEYVGEEAGQALNAPLYLNYVSSD
jgi:hypothetical protein